MDEITIKMNEFRELTEQATRLGIIRRLVIDTDAQALAKGYGANIDTAVLRQVIGMAPVEVD